MMTVKEVSRLTGVSIRTLQYYDNIGLLKAAAHTPSGYRLYDDAALEWLQQILLFRELEFPLKDIRRILQSSDFDRRKAVDQQIRLLQMKKEHIDRLIALARGIYATGGNIMDFSAFDTSKLDDYTRQAKQQWGNTPAYAEYQNKSAGRTRDDQAALGAGLMEIFAEMGRIRQTDPAAPASQALVQKLRDYITCHYYTCTDGILRGLGQMYAAGGELAGNIDAAGGSGTALFAGEAIEACCGK